MVLGLEGAVTFKPPFVLENAGRLIRWFMFTLWVTEESAIIVTFDMLAESGVPTKKVSPSAMLPGANEMLGRAPLKR